MIVQAVIFDLDNTLVNRRKAFELYTEHLIDRFIFYSSQVHREQIKEYIRDADCDGYRAKRDLYQDLLDNLRWKHEMTVDQLLDFWFSEFYKFTFLMEDAIEILERLKRQGYKLGIITNGSVYAQNLKIDQVGLRKYFDVIVVSDEVKVKKPDSKIFQHALDQFGLSPQESVYVGDHPHNDIKGAREAGIRPIWLRGFKKWDSSINPTVTIDGLRELEDFLELRN